MPSTQRRHNSSNVEDNNEGNDNLAVDMENQNNNRIKANDKDLKSKGKASMRNQTHAKLNPKRGKSTTESSNDKALPNSDEHKSNLGLPRNKYVASFEEDNDIVEMDVEGEITSEGELPSDTDESKVDDAQNDGNTSGYSADD